MKTNSLRMGHAVNSVDKFLKAFFPDKFSFLHGKAQSRGHAVVSEEVRLLDLPALLLRKESTGRLASLSIPSAPTHSELWCTCL